MNLQLQQMSIFVTDMKCVNLTTEFEISGINNLVQELVR